MAPERDSLQMLRRLVRQQANDVVTPAELVDELRTVLGPRPRTRTSRRRLITVFVATAAVATSAVGAAAVFFGQQPSRPEGGLVCRAAPDLYADAVVIGAGKDVIEACEEAWASGLVTGTSEPPPPLTACIGQNGVVEVFPNLAGCDLLGLQEAATQPVGETAAVTELQSWAADEVNLGECRPAADVVVLVEDELERLELATWRVELSADPPRGVCAKVQVDSPSRTVIVLDT